MNVPQPFSLIADGDLFVLNDLVCLKLDGTHYTTNRGNSVLTLDPETEVLPRPATYNLFECELGNRWARVQWSGSKPEQTKCRCQGYLEMSINNGPPNVTGEHSCRVIRQTDDKIEAQEWKRDIKEYPAEYLRVDRALNKFAEAAQELSAAWEVIGDGGERHPMVDFYPVGPFRDDFADITAAIVDWRDRGLGYSAPEFEPPLTVISGCFGSGQVHPARSNHFTNEDINRGHFPDHITRDGQAMMRPEEIREIAERAGMEVVGFIKAGPVSPLRSLNNARARVVERRENGTPSKVKLIEPYDLYSEGDIVEVDEFEFVEGIPTLGKAGQHGDE